MGCKRKKAFAGTALAIASIISALASAGVGIGNAVNTAKQQKDALNAQNTSNNLNDAIETSNTLNNSNTNFTQMANEKTLRCGGHRKLKSCGGSRTKYVNGGLVKYFDRVNGLHY